MNIGNKIRELRIKEGYTQEELANKLNVTPQAVSRWECGVSLPDITMLPLISKAFFVTTDHLLGCDLKVNALFASCDNLHICGEVLNQTQIDCIFKNRDVCSDGTLKKVLHIDDSDFMRKMVADMLTKSGHTVLGASDVNSALSIMEQYDVDVIILDINMPGMNGIDYLRGIKKFDNTIIMLSALSCESIVKEAYSLGANAFVAKPFQAESIINRI